MSFAVVIPTLNPGPVWDELIKSIQVQSVLPDRVLIIDSGSIDGCREKSESSGFDVITIEKSEFDHGGTRKAAVEIQPNVDFIIFMTQDALLSSACSFKQILAPFYNKKVGAVCGRQLPRKFATPIEAHARNYNYPADSYIRSSSDINRFGLKSIFISNSFAAYRMSALNLVGEFPKKVIFGEDMYVAAKMLKAGYKIAYSAEACVYHSHDYSLLQELKRYFDMGVFHANEPWIRQEFGGAEGEGVKFVISELKYLMEHSFWRVPEGAVRTLLRYTGFRLGLMEKGLPLSLKRALAMNKGYFKR